MNQKINFFIKKLYVTIFSKTTVKENKLVSNHNRQTIGIAIPLASHHSKHLNSLLKYISHSEILPDVVSISLSSYSCTKEFNFEQFPFKIILTKTKLYQNAAQNRNTAARKLKTNIITFFDADDLPHIKRISYILEAFSKGSLVCVHNYLQNSKRNFDFPYSEIGPIEYYHNSINSKGLNCLFPVCNFRSQIYACGHISISREIFKKYKFKESKFYLNMEDAEFATRLVENKIFISYIQNNLSFYVK